MSNYTELTKRLRMDGANLPLFDLAADAIEALQQGNAELRAEVDALSQDAACFRFWVREAAQSPCDMAKLIMRCVTEQDYRDVIMPIALAADKAIASAKGGTDG
ncbi:hypothetical protein C8C99_0262 [Acidovorax sp. 107]|uniref:hypothetical protein n=1 Tax=Acidovorax sp. 107 TaxID=2135638 RepID=UPI000D38CE25|nr:hypothetical protein [Acidovorax sp. 107]PUA95462.1 hypothetical protein C8C99_0262 [Acidovorax sp. 107]